MPAGDKVQVIEGVNVVGEMGLGEVARQYVAALQEAGVPVATKTYIHFGNRNEHAFVDVDTDETYPRNLICLQPLELMDFYRDVGEEFFRNRHTVGVWGREIDAFPEDWLDALDFVDEVWAWTDYVAGTFDEQVFQHVAGGNVIFSSAGVEVETASFDEIINEASEGGRKRVKLLKIDCEGSEFPILFTSQTLHLIDDIRGEFHEYGGDHDPHSIPENARVEGFDRFTIEELTKVLEREGFTVTSERSGDTNLGLFFATRNR
ncbi:MAG: FkbM family methyltransferase [Rubrobacter sp.]|nr:FkbM family methyltransferase [Rubrobacter sp.]